MQTDFDICLVATIRRSIVLASSQLYYKLYTSLQRRIYTCISIHFYTYYTLHVFDFFGSILVGVHEGLDKCICEIFEINAYTFLN